jgi:hypothetical protein
LYLYLFYCSKLMLKKIKKKYFIDKVLKKIDEKTSKKNLTYLIL